MLHTNCISEYELLMKELLSYIDILIETIIIVHVALTAEITACQGNVTNFKNF